MPVNASHLAIPPASDFTMNHPDVFLAAAQRPVLRPHFPRSGRLCTEWSAMEQIFDQAVSVCILRSPVPAPVKQYLAQHCPAKSNELSAVIDSSDSLEQLLQDFPAAGRTALQQHLLRLIELFRTVADCERVGARLAITHQPMCPRFHVDRIGVRLLCTLQGPGTEWLEYADVDRRFLGFGSKGIPDAYSGLLRPGAQIHAMQPGDIGLFKGESWPGNAGRGAVHRSPEVKPLSSHRIIVTLDAVD